MGERRLRVVSLSSQMVRYSWSLQLQESLAAAARQGDTPDTLLVLQHHPVFTVGKRGSQEDLLTSREELRRLGFDLCEVPRGGQTTFHGPGQLVCYPVLNLRRLGLGARAFVEGLEDAMAATAGCFGVQARGRVPGKTGVWVGERKLGAVGVRISHGVSSHGLAFNVATPLQHYRHIVPCGTPDKAVTSLAAELRLAQPQQQHACQQHQQHQQQQPGHQPAGDEAGAEAVAGNGAWSSSSSSRSSTGTRQGSQAAAAADHHGWLMRAAEACLVDSLARGLRMLPVEANAAEVAAVVAQAGPLQPQ